jgi:predicted kinase
MFIIFCGLPGTGKTTLARMLAEALAAVHVRIDSIEEALLMMGQGSAVDDGAGYRIGYAVSEDNLRLGRIVVADSVNPLRLTREAWRDVARKAGVTSVDVVVVCSDQAEHRRRIEARETGIRRLTWDDVVDRAFDPMDQRSIVLDTAGQSIEQSLSALQTAISGHCSN